MDYAVATWDQWTETVGDTCLLRFLVGTKKLQECFVSLREISQYHVRVYDSSSNRRL